METNAVQCRPSHQSLLPLVVWVTGLTLFSLIGIPFSRARAQSPVDLSVDVNATVPDWVAPSTPILVSPTDGSSITDSTPTFIWQAATDNVGVTGYALFLDGNVYIASIPTSATETSVFALTYDSGTARFSLTPKSSIADGSHTWKIVARDAAGNTTSSATWTFLIDSQAPTFVITAIGEETTSISVQDTSTIPTEAIELTENEPILSGTGEANSTVVLQVRKQSDNSLVDEYTFTIGSDGNWSVELRTLERAVIFHLTFQITDRVGLLSILEDVPLTITSYEVIIPWPDEPVVIPLPVVPFETLSRTIHIVTYEMNQVAQVVTTALVPAGARATFVSAKQTSTRFLSPVWYTHLLVLFLVLALPLLKWLALASPFGRNFSLNIGWTIWLAIIGFSGKKQHSLIINATNQRALPFMTARLVPLQPAEGTTTTSETKLLMSDQHGFLPTWPKLSGDYVLKISQDEMPRDYPKLRSPHLAWEDWYQGQPLRLLLDQVVTPLIAPISPDSTHQRSNWKTWLLNRPIDSITILVLAVLMLMITPTIGNFICTTLFGGIWLAKSWRSKLVNAHFIVITHEKVPVAQTVLRLTSANIQQRTILSQVGDTGESAVHLENGRYDCSGVHNKFRQKTPLVIDSRSKSEQQLVVLMTSVLP